MMKALVLGDRHAIPEHIRELFVRTGTAHVLAISGLHVGLIALVLVMVLRLGPWPRWVAYVAMVFLLGGYAMMTGFRPSVVRAWIMVSVVFLGFAWEREGDVYNNLSLAAFILLLINPMHIRMISFQLSFVSVIAILVFQPFIYRLLSTGWWGNYPLGRGLANAVAVSLAAEIGIAPLIAYYFDLLTPVGPLANVWIIPLMMGVLILGLGLLALGSVSALLAGWWAMLIKIGLNLTSFIAYGLSRIPGAYVWVESPSVRWLYAYYGLLLLTSWCVRKHLFRKNDPALSKSGKKYTTGGNKTFAKWRKIVK
jgi:competence protein ComEC